MARKPLSTSPTIWTHVDRAQLLKLARSFYNGGLAKSDNRPATWPDKAIPMPHIVPQGKSLGMDITYSEFEEVVLHVRLISVVINGITIQGWHEYVLRTLLKFEQPHWQKNEFMPKVRDSHYQESLEVWGRAFFRLILDKK
ncbi:MAG: hypothetical protein ACO1RX_20090 [Candidatus Sericytochromatia bacterium]